MDFTQRVTGSSQGSDLFADRFPFRGRLSSRAGTHEELLQIGIHGEIPDDRLNGTNMQPELLREGWGTDVLQEVGTANLEVPVCGAEWFLERACQSVGACHESIKWEKK